MYRARNESPVLRQDMTGAERKFALSYVPQEDIIRYNKGSKVFGINKGDYARVLNTTTRTTSSRLNSRMDVRLLTTRKDSQVFPSTRKPTDSSLLAIASSFVRPSEANVKNTELGTITNIAQGMFTVSLSADRIITFDPEHFRTWTTAMQ